MEEDFEIINIVNKIKMKSLLAKAITLLNSKRNILLRGKGAKIKMCEWMDVLGKHLVKCISTAEILKRKYKDLIQQNTIYSEEAFVEKKSTKEKGFDYESVSFPKDQHPSYISCIDILLINESGFQATNDKDSKSTTKPKKGFQGNFKSKPFIFQDS